MKRLLHRVWLLALGMCSICMVAPAQIPSSLEGTVWRYTESKNAFTTLKFTSVAGGYFLFNNYERKFIFTYQYADGVGVLYRDKTEFRNSRDASRLAESKFIIDADTLIYDGREFVRLHTVGYERPTVVQSDLRPQPSVIAGTGEEASNIGSVRPEDGFQDSTNTTKRTQQSARTEPATSPNAQPVESQEPEYWAVATDVTGFEGREVSGAMPRSRYKGPETGKHVLRIWVNRSGEVVRAEPNQSGTTLTDSESIKKARTVAMKLRLVPKDNAPSTQTGYITVVFSKIK